MDFEFSVLEFPKTRIAGITVETDLKHAQQNCQALWEKFGKRVTGELAGHKAIPEDAAKYGVYQMLTKDKFSYCAGVEINSDTSLPSDLKVITIPPGMYVTCQVSDISKLEDAYKALYEKWPSTQIDYVIDNKGLCFERYDYEWEKSDPFEIYVAVSMKEPN